MLFIVDYEVCALLFLIVIAIHFFYKYKFPTTANRFFGLFVICALIDLAMDILGSYTIAHSHVIPLWINMLVNSIYYCLQLFMASIMYLYILCITGKLNNANKAIIGLTMVPVIIYELTLLTNPVTKAIFYFDEEMNYVRGVMFNMLYSMTFFYIAVALICLMAFRKNLPKSQFYSILIFSFIIVGTVILQVVFREYLLTGVGIAIAITMMYLVLQNPAEMLDDMTQLLNRTSFLKYMEQHLSKDRNCQVIFLGIDRMRTINQTFGMKMGNEVLARVASSLEKSTSKALVFRITGDIFAIVSKNEEAGKKNIAAVQKCFDTPYVIGEVEIKLTACVCSAIGIQCQYSESELIMVMESLLEQAKKQGRGTQINVDESTLREMERQFVIESGLREAVDNDEMEIVLQPIYSTKTKNFVRAEALLRFRHKLLGNIPPSEFVPLAERNGLIVKIGAQIQNRVCKFIKENHLDEIEGFEGIEINLSAVELLQPQLCGQILEITKKYELDPKYIMFEVTGTTATRMKEQTNKTMNDLRKQGITFALDDFGTGYANMESLMKLPFALIKIDRSVMLDSFSNDKSRIIFKHMIDMIEDLGIETVVEGVETSLQAETICKMGVGYIQGYYYAKPMSMEDFTEFIAER